MRRRALPALLLSALGACGYTVGGLYPERDVRVETFDNVSERRTHELELTGAVVREMVSRGFRVNGADAEIVVEAVGEGDRILLAVADGGRGIPEADRSRAVERFVRLEQSRSLPGSGLGLSLASAVARLHGGELRLEDNHPGLRTVIALPRAGAAPATA